jgi:glycosyltransferase involved in cell wall biosynthesis
MQKLSAVIITFNEAKYIEQCIRSAAEVADEIIVVDSFSTDKTKEICLSQGVRFIEHPFKGYRDQKNYALTQTSYDYVISLDADEALSPELQKSILAEKQDFKYDGYKFNRLNNYCGKWMYHTNLFPESKIRIFNKKRASWSGYNIHEKIVLNNPKSLKRLKGNLHHWLYDSYEESIAKMNNYTTLLASEYFNQGITANPKRLILNPGWRFFHSFFIKGGFLDGYDGFIVSKLLATTCFLKYVKLRKLYIKAKRSKWTKGINIEDTNKSIKNTLTISVGFDAKRAFYNASGLGNYSRNLLITLSHYHPENSYLLFTPKSKNRFIIENESQFKIIEPDLTVFRWFNPLWRSLFINNDIRRHRVNVFHGLSQELPIWIESTGVKTIVTIHDLIFIRYPEFYNWIDVKIYYYKLIHSCRVSDRIVAVSNQTKNDLVRFLDVSPEKITVIHQGCNACFWKDYSNEFHQEVRTKHNLPEKYLLYVGTIEERKNLLTIIIAIHKMKIDIPLVVIGRKAEVYYRNVLNYISTNKIHNVLFPENVLSSELAVIYQDAECFIYPSFFEGFGIPLLEAIVSKIPVITSKSGCFTEAAGPGAIYIDPHNPEQIGEAILSVVGNKELRDKMIAIGTEYSNNFRDETIADAYTKLYRSLVY